MTRKAIVRIPMLSVVVAVSFAAVLVGQPAGHADHADHGPGHTSHVTSVLRTPSQVAFHDQMRKLWEDHITWTRLAIVSFAGGLPDLQATEQRLLANQDDIGNAVAPFYGQAAGAQLSALLKTHITTAVDILVAAKSGDSAALTKAEKAWYVNANEIADFLSTANPRFLPDDVMRSEMRAHLDETLKEAVDRLHGDFTADIADYEVVHEHILHMADLLSSGIMRQFPERFAK
jgi:hypothetical protein